MLLIFGALYLNSTRDHGRRSTSSGRGLWRRWVSIQSCLCVSSNSSSQWLVGITGMLPTPRYLIEHSAGIGLFFSAFMVCVTAIQARYTEVSPRDSEEFNAASRSVKPGLIASGIVSAWTWAADLVSIPVLACLILCYTTSVTI